MDRFTALTETPSRGSQESGANTDQTLDVPRKIMKKISTKSCKYEAGHVGGLVFSGGHLNKCFDARRSVSLYIGEL